jgi:hypothetical protein
MSAEGPIGVADGNVKGGDGGVGVGRQSLGGLDLWLEDVGGIRRDNCDVGLINVDGLEEDV